ncbi:hypothetical protein ACFLYD_01625 [Chloroflexota bacterium]|jgi:hypothetical protein
MTKTAGHVPPFQQQAPVDRTVKWHLLQLADGAYARAERSRRSWYRTRRTKTPEVAARLRRRMLKHQAIAYHLDEVCRGCP